MLHIPILSDIFSYDLYRFVYDYESRENRFWVHLIPWTTVVLYLLFVFNAKRILGTKKRKINVFAWNYFLHLLSVAMTLGMAIPYGLYIYQNGFFDAVCQPADAQNGRPLDTASRPLFAPGSMVFWGVVFSLSKYFELFDTIALLIKDPNRNPWKMPFSLHWFHHFTVLSYCWYATYYLQPTSYLFAIINAVIHSFLYYYYAMAEKGVRIWWAPYLTVAQTAQMLLGIAINLYYFYQWKVNGYNCAGYNPGIILICAAAMYGIYFYLFFKMALDRWVFKKYKQQPLKKQK